jgi:chromosome segregation ATPase
MKKKIAENGKKVAKKALESARKDFEKLQETHDEDLRLIKNLRKDHEKSSKAAEHLRINNADLAMTLRNKERKIQDLEKALADHDEASRKEAEIRDKLKLLFKEYRKALREFGVRLAPLPANAEISDFMKWTNTEFKAFFGVILGASDFAATFSDECRAYSPGTHARKEEE